MQITNQPVSRKTIWICLIIFGICSPAFALEKVQIEEVSSTKNTMIINRGRLDGVNQGMEAYFLKTVREKDLSKDFIGMAEAVKVYERYSVWYFKKTVNPSFVVARKFVDMVPFEDLARKRAPFKIRTRSVIDSKKISQKEKKLIHDSGSDLETVKRKGNYRLGQVLSDLDDAKDYEELNVLELSRWTDRKKNIVRGKTLDNIESYAVKYSSAPDINDLVDTLERKEGAQTVSSFLDKTADGKFSAQTFFDDQEKLEGSKKFNKSSGLIDQTKREKLRDRKADIDKKKVVRQLRSRGLDWSEDFSDEELIFLVNRHGLYKENERQVRAIKTVISSEVSAYFSVNVGSGDAETNSSGQNLSSNPTNFGIGYEHMWIKNNLKLSNFSTEFSFFTGNRNYDLDGLIKTTELYGRIQGLYYLQKSPAETNSFLPYAGLGLKLGNISTRVDSDDFSYNLFSYLASAGVKYRLGTRFGFRGQLAYVSNQLDRNGGQQTDLVKSGTFNNLEFEFAFSYFF